MQSRLTDKTIFFNWQTALLLFLFGVIRVASFALAHSPITQAMIVFILTLTLGVLYFKNEDWAWMLILGELLLGGSGHLFEFFGLSLRTIFIVTFFVLWVLMNAIDEEKRNALKVPHNMFYFFIPLFFFLGISAITGLVNGHGTVAIIQDLIPFTFLLLLLPAYHLFKNENVRHYFIRLIIVFLIGSAVFSLFTFIMFRLGWSELQDPFYKWFRDVIMGKITVVTDYYFRIVAPEHLLVAPLMLIISSLLMKDEKHNYLWRFLFIMGGIILALNFSRAYLLSFTFGLIIIFYTHTFWKSVKVSAWAVVVLIALFTSINLVSSLGKSLGWEIVGIRLGSLTAPHIERSTDTRMALLEPIGQLIGQYPLIGSGLGATVTYFDPETYQETTTRHFDWGYLELWAELGLFGAIWFLVVIGAVVVQLIKTIRSLSDYHDFHVGLLGGMGAMILMTITTPALFHVLGICYLIFIVAFISKPLDIFEELVTTLYRIFNRIKNSVY